MNQHPPTSEFKTKVHTLTDIPSIAQYLNRIGAEPRSLHSAVVKRDIGKYWRDIETIRISKDGEVTASDECKPTAKEADDIRTEFSAALWPELVKLPGKLPPLPEHLEAARQADQLWEFRNEAGELVMLQQRLEKGGGGKAYIPWTYYDDEEWRSLQPEGPLPLWGIDQLKHHSVAFIHEGAKSARHVRRLIEDQTSAGRQRLVDHPWGEELQHAAHLGWIGGALNPSKTDWAVLNRLGVTEVIIVVDNDPPGTEALTDIAKELRRWSIQVKAVRFNDDFPRSFDLGDEFPDKLFETVKGRRVYKGPSFKDQCRPATWMTVQNPVPAQTGRGRPPAPTYRLRKEAIGQWWLVTHEKKPLFVANQDRTRFFTEEAFNTAVRPFSDVLNNAALLKQHIGVQVEAIAYEPGRKQGVITVDGRQSINTWTPTRIKPVKGDAAPWHRFLEHLLPSEQDRQEVMRWVATLAARPEIRMKYGLVLCSKMHGVGKTTLCEILKALVGPENASAPSATDIKSDYNDWFIRRRLIWVNEIYEGGSWTTYNKLKSFITDDDHLSHAKFEGRYPVKNWAHFVLCSNSTKPLTLEEEDRRFFVPEVTENKTLPGGWDDFHQWLRGDGLGIILNWAQDALKSGRLKPVGPGEHAPPSARKARMIADSRSEEETLVRELAAMAQELSDKREGRQVVFIYDEIKSWLAVQMREPWERKKDFALRLWLEGAGLHVPAKQFKVDGKMRRVAALLPVPDDHGWPDLKPRTMKPEDLIEADL